VLKLLSTLLLIVCATTVAWAESFKLTDGNVVEGDIVLPAKADALQVRLGGGKYERIPWEKLTQETLLRLKDNPAVAQFVEPLIEIPDEVKVKKTEVVIREVPRLERPPQSSILGGLFASPVGWLALLLIYAANLYAGYELAIVRAYPPLMVCGISAVAPIIGPIIFLCLPTKLASTEETSLVEAAAATQAHAANVHETTAAHEAAQAAAGGLHTVATAPEPSSVPEPQVFKRGQFTFNKRFIETKFAGFFGLARREADKDLILVIKTSRSTATATRITRIAANDLHVETSHGEVQIAFTDIQEITLKHKDA
jgi:hypothetical protein